MASMRSLASTRSRRVTIVLITMALLAGSAALLLRRTTPRTHSTAAAGRARTSIASTTTTAAQRPTTASLPIPAALVDPALDMRAGPVPVPLVLQMPTLGVDAAVIGVGITAKNAMDAPEGKASDPVWQEAFWYRGSATPGALSTALLAGHVDSPRGPAVFSHLDRLRPGDPIIVHDTRSGLDVRFSVTSSATIPLDQTTDPAVLTHIYGAGPVAGTWAQPSLDGLAHLSLVTCAGTFRNGTHDHRLVVYATRIA